MASSMTLMVALCIVSTVSWAGSAQSCMRWASLESKALNRLMTCDDEPVQRQVGQVCLRHEWRCGEEPFGQWLASWLAEMREPIAMAMQGDQLVFSGQFGADHLALFWKVRPEDKPGFQVLVSRIRPVIEVEAK